MNKTVVQAKQLLVNEPLSLLRFVLCILATETICRDIIYLTRASFFDWSTVHKSWFLMAVPESLVMAARAHPWIAISIILAMGAAAALGVFGRLFLILVALSAFTISGARDGIGFFDHDIALSSQVLLILALVPNSMNVSVDKYLLPRIGLDKLLYSSTKNWGVHLILVLLAVTYFTAGISKIRYGGLKWMDGKTLSFYFENHIYRYEPGTKQLFIGEISTETKRNEGSVPKIHGFTYGNYKTTGLNFTNWLVKNKWIMIFLSIFSIVFELSGAMVFLGPRYRNIFLTTAILFHTGIGLMMGLYFTHYRVVAFFLISWNKILKVQSSP